MENIKITGRISSWDQKTNSGYIIPNKTVNGYCGHNISFVLAVFEGERAQLTKDSPVDIIFSIINDKLIATTVIASEICESCDNNGYLEVTHEDATYIEPCENCNYIDMHGDLKEQVILQAERDGYNLSSKGKVLD